jgi:hypothetical protein
MTSNAVDYFKPFAGGSAAAQSCIKERIMALKPLVWSSLWNEYPDYINYTSKQVKQEIGGAVADDWITNTCAIRLSRTLNYNGVPVPGNFSGMSTVKGGDGKRYAFRVREIDRWMHTALGKPDFEIAKKENAAFDKTTLSGSKGIIGFNIRFADATGHLDLWDGSRFSSEHATSRDYWTAAAKIWMWNAI